jgi:hypothetical protein
MGQHRIQRSDDHRARSARLACGLDHGPEGCEQNRLITIGLYNETAGAYLPSILF